jgi:hypothetical protein
VLGAQGAPAAPGALPEQSQGGGDQDAADHGGVDEYRRGRADAQEATARWSAATA